MRNEEFNTQQEQFCMALTLKQLEGRNQSLESRIREVEAELRLKDELIRQNQLHNIGDLIAKLAHQWLQPLNNISLIVQGLLLAFKRNDLSAEEMNADVSEVMKELHHITETIFAFRKSFKQE